MRRVVVVFFVIGVLLFFMNYLGSIFFGYPGGDLLSLRQWYELRTQYSEGGERGTRPPSPGHQEWKCPARSAKSDVQMLNLYDQLPFDNEIGGVWVQGFNITYDPVEMQKEKRLEVIVVPHSHNDPGWGWTFEEYYDMRTQYILNGMVKHLPLKPDMKFIYAEMSFFELWWSKISEQDRELARSFLRSGQLEIVTGGWVMTDEANARSFSIVMELIEGHEFLRNQLDYRPRSHWSIDPFGLSPTLAQLVKSSNLTDMTIQRVHYSVKKYLAKTRQLEFQWRQMYAEGTESDIRTHMMPFQGYAASLTCGPDPKICCQFDFEKLGGQCDWGVNPRIITKANVAARAELLVDQYRKKAQLYRMNVILVPLGDDFRYMSNSEWEDQYSNYRLLFEYMNQVPKWNINARFGTLRDYFDLLDMRLAEEPSEPDLPILSGDFFTYADRDDHYWSGYYTSRPFYKHMDRTVQHYVRSADILFSLAQWKAKHTKEAFPFADFLYEALVQSRRSLSLFQHHDGVTGTSRDYVVLDYGKKMLSAINESMNIMANVAAYLLDIPSSRDNRKNLLKPDIEYHLDTLPTQLKVDTGSSILVHNSLGFKRQEIICLVVASTRSRIRRGHSEPLQQVQPRIKLENGRFSVEPNQFDLCFEAVVLPLGFERYELIEGDNSEHMAKLRVSNNFDKSTLPTEATRLAPNDIVALSNRFLSAKFDATTGYLKSIQYAKEKELDVRLEFLHYGARDRRKDKRFTGPNSMSGLYLFLPHSDAKSLDVKNNTFVIIEGAVRNSILLRGPDEALVYQHIYLDLNSKALNIINRVDVRATSNFELSMRIHSSDFNSDSNEQFYTDLNGFQMIRRKRFDKLPIQAHFYPMTTAGYINANRRRLTLLGRQSLGVASLKAGMIESILDRRLGQDDDRGIGQGDLDNKQTESHFRLLVETLQEQSSEKEENNRAGFLSASAIQSSHSLNYPLDLFHGKFEPSSSIVRSWSPLKKSLSCDLHLFAFRTVSEPTKYPGNGQRSTKPRFEASMIIERQGVECLIESNVEGCDETSGGKFRLQDYFNIEPTHVKSTSLTGLYEKEETLRELQLSSKDLKAIKVEF